MWPNRSSRAPPTLDPDQLRQRPPARRSDEEVVRRQLHARGNGLSGAAEGVGQAGWVSRVPRTESCARQRSWKLHRRICRRAGRSVAPYPADGRRGLTTDLSEVRSARAVPALQPRRRPARRVPPAAAEQSLAVRLDLVRSTSAAEGLQRDNGRDKSRTRDARLRHRYAGDGSGSDTFDRDSAALNHLAAGSLAEYCSSNNLK